MIDYYGQHQGYSTRNEAVKTLEAEVAVLVDLGLPRCVAQDFLWGMSLREVLESIIALCADVDARNLHEVYCAWCKHEEGRKCDLSDYAWEQWLVDHLAGCACEDERCPCRGT